MNAQKGNILISTGLQKRKLFEALAESKNGVSLTKQSKVEYSPQSELRHKDECLNRAAGSKQTRWIWGFWQVVSQSEASRTMYIVVTERPGTSTSTHIWIDCAEDRDAPSEAFGRFREASASSMIGFLWWRINRMWWEWLTRATIYRRNLLVFEPYLGQLFRLGLLKRVNLTSFRMISVRSGRYVFGLGLVRVGKITMGITRVRWLLARFFFSCELRMFVVRIKSWRSNENAFILYGWVGRASNF